MDGCAPAEFAGLEAAQGVTQDGAAGEESCFHRDVLICNERDREFDGSHNNLSNWLPDC